MFWTWFTSGPSSNELKQYDEILKLREIRDRLESELAEARRGNDERDDKLSKADKLIATRDLEIDVLVRGKSRDIEQLKSDLKAQAKTITENIASSIADCVDYPLGSELAKAIRTQGQPCGKRYGFPEKAELEAAKAKMVELEAQIKSKDAVIADQQQSLIAVDRAEATFLADVKAAVKKYNDSIPF